MDCTSNLLKTIFPDSVLASSLSCARTKTEAIINNVIAPYAIQQIITSLSDIKFIGVSTDASNHNAEKIFPIMIQYFDVQNGGIQTKLLDVTSTPNETAETVTNIILETLQKHHLTEKCISFTADNANVNFGGINRPAGGRNILNKLKTSLNKDVIGVGCPAHLLHNCIKHGADVMAVDIESLVMKMFNFFSVYTVRTEELKSICEYVDVCYQKLLYHSKTRWLSLFPAIERILKMYLPLKTYFLDQIQPPAAIKSFFENELSEAYLFFLHSFMSIFQFRITEIERENNSVLDVINILQSTHDTLKSRLEATFLPIAVKERLSSVSMEKREAFTKEVKKMYEACISYLNNWFRPLDEFKIFEWMSFKKNTNINFENDLTATIRYLTKKGIAINDVNLFDEITALNSFVKQQEDSYFDLLPEGQWKEFFLMAKTKRFPELLQICQFVFAIQAQNANDERVFSFMGAQWTKERNRLSVFSVKGLLLTQFNLKNLTCEAFYSQVLQDDNLLKQISGSKKYEGK